MLVFQVNIECLHGEGTTRSERIYYFQQSKLRNLNMDFYFMSENSFLKWQQIWRFVIFCQNVACLYQFSRKRPILPISTPILSLYLYQKRLKALVTNRSKVFLNRSDVHMSNDRLGLKGRVQIFICFGYTQQSKHLIPNAHPRDRKNPVTITLGLMKPTGPNGSTQSMQSYKQFKASLQLVTNIKLTKSEL